MAERVPDPSEVLDRPAPPPTSHRPVRRAARTTSPTSGSPTPTPRGRPAPAGRRRSTAASGGPATTARTSGRCAMPWPHQGYAVAAIEYRRTGMPRRRLARHRRRRRRRRSTRLPDLVAAAAGRPAGPAVVLVGHSAGGHLALWAGSQAASRGWPASSAWPGSATWSAPTSCGSGAQGDDGAVAAFLGGSPPRCRSSTPRPTRCSCRRPERPVVLIHGSQDTVVPIELSRRYADARRRRSARRRRAGRAARHRALRPDRPAQPGLGRGPRRAATGWPTARLALPHAGPRSRLGGRAPPRRHRQGRHRQDHRRRGPGPGAGRRGPAGCCWPRSRAARASPSCSTSRRCRTSSARSRSGRGGGEVLGLAVDAKAALLGVPPALLQAGPGRPRARAVRRRRLRHDRRARHARRR